LSGFNVILAPFNVRWEGSDNLSGDGGSLNLHSAVQMERPGIRVSDGKAQRCADGKARTCAYPMGRRCDAHRRWESMGNLSISWEVDNLPYRGRFGVDNLPRLGRGGSGS